MVSGDGNAICRCHAKQFLAGCCRTFLIHVEADMPIGLLHGHDVVVAGICNEQQALALAFNVEGCVAWGVPRSRDSINTGDDAVARLQHGHFVGGGFRREAQRDQANLI